jgi:6-pyruvoyltetrahydropterin/6-carboxytetrahydropterin synthase
MDFGDLKKIINAEIIDLFDHANLNTEIDFSGMPGEAPTAENMVIWISERLRKVFRQDLIRVRVYETPDSFAEWRRS